MKITLCRVLLEKRRLILRDAFTSIMRALESLVLELYPLDIIQAVVEPQALPYNRILGNPLFNKTIRDRQLI